MSAIPKTMKAIVLDEPGKTSIHEIDVPTLEDDEVLVKVAYAGLNPTDWKHIAFISSPGVSNGCDYSGTVAVASPKYPNLPVGTKVAGGVHGNKFPGIGSFAEYLKVKGVSALPLPESLKLEEGNSLGIPYQTALMAVFLSQKNSAPPAKRSPGDWFFIQGGSTAVGLYAIQLAKVAGYSVIASASPHNFDLLKSLGADEVVDYHDVDAAIKQIKEKTNGGVVGALETIGGDDATKLAVQAIKEEGGIVTILGQAQSERPEVKIDNILWYTVGGYAFDFLPGKPGMPALPHVKAWWDSFSPIASKLIDDYKIKANPVEVRDGLDNIHIGLEELKSGKVSAKKLTYKL